MKSLHALTFVCIAILGFLVLLPPGVSGETQSGSALQVGVTHIFVMNDGVSVVPSPINASGGGNTPEPTLSPLPATIGSLDAISASNVIASDLTKRGLFAHSDYSTFWKECHNAQQAIRAHAVQFHWIVPDPNNVSFQNSFLGVSWTRIAIAWSLYDCDGVQLLDGTQPLWESRVYQKYSWRIPLSQIMALVQLTNVLHTNTIKAPLIAGFSSGAGSVNTYLDQANPQAQIIERTFFTAADHMASDFCGTRIGNSNKDLGCWKTSH